MTGSLDTKVAIITGSGKGLGKAIAQLFAAEGATVVISDIDAVAAEKTAESIPGASAIACDVRDEDQVKALVEQTVDQHGGLHVMVANAGVGTAAPLLEIDLEMWRRVTSVNLDGVFLTIRYAAPAIIASGGGSIVTLSSVTATAGTPLLAPYAAAKAAVLNLAKTAAIEFRDHGVRVNALLPGAVRTDLLDSLLSMGDHIMGLPAGDFANLFTQKQGRFGTAAEVAEAALFFASDRSAFCTGSGLILDGGLDASLL